MKIKRYDKTALFKFLFFVVILLFVILLGICNLKKIKTYNRVDGIIVKDGMVSTFVADEVLSSLYKNNFCYFKDQKIRIKVEKVNLRMFYQQKKEYHQVILSFTTKEKFVVNDSVSFFFFKENVSFLSLVFRIWKGD